MTSSKNIVNIVTDDKGFAKFCTFRDVAIPATEATIYLSGREPAMVELVVRPVQVNISAEIESVSMACPVCHAMQVHKCAEMAEDQDDDNCTG